MAFCPSSSRPRLSETSWWFSTMTPRIGPRLPLPLPLPFATGGGRRDLSMLIAASGKLGPSGLVAGLELEHDRGDVGALVGVGDTKPFAEGPKPTADLFQSVDRGHVELKRRQRGQTLPQDLGPSPGLCPPVDRLNVAAPRSHTGANGRRRSAKLGAKIHSPNGTWRCTLRYGGKGLARHMARLERASGRGSDNFRPARGGGMDLDLRGTGVGSPLGDLACQWKP